MDAYPDAADVWLLASATTPSIRYVAFLTASSDPETVMSISSRSAACLLLTRGGNQSMRAEPDQPLFEASGAQSTCNAPKTCAWWCPLPHHHATVLARLHLSDIRPVLSARMPGVFADFPCGSYLVSILTTAPVSLSMAFTVAPPLPITSPTCLVGIFTISETLNTAAVSA